MLLAHYLLGTAFYIPWPNILVSHACSNWACHNGFVAFIGFEASSIGRRATMDIIGTIVHSVNNKKSLQLGSPESSSIGNLQFHSAKA